MCPKPGITAIGIATPAHAISQTEVAEFMQNFLNLTNEETARMKALYRATGIERRHSVIPDYHQTSENFEFFSPSENLEPLPSTHKRMQFYQKHALPLAQEAIQKCLDDPARCRQITHLITVSCTGMYAPGLDIDLVNTLPFRSSVERTCINFMGCYAVFNALKLARSICALQAEAQVLIVSVEISSLHFQKDKKEDFMLSNALFADGAAAALISSQSLSRPKLILESAYADICSHGMDDMKWAIGDFGFEMTLSSAVPEIIKQNIQQLVNRLLNQSEVSFSSIQKFAIHPGGKRILEVIEKVLAIDRKSNTIAWEILKNYGNMSSATILFVLHNLCRKLSAEDDGDRILALAFGPGLTLESMILRVENN